MAAMWSAVAVAKSENRRELKLGKEVSEKIEKEGLDTSVYQLVNLNFLAISGTCLSSLADDVGNLTNLLNLDLQQNKLETLPATIGKLTKLKFLNVSHNCLTSLPAEIAELRDLETLKAEVNQLTECPDISGLKSLHKLELSHNALTALPEGIADKELAHLSTIAASNNAITTLPTDLSNLPHLNVLDVSDNQIEELPNELSECTRLKELKVSGNKIRDKRLAKFTDQNNLKQIIQYLTAALEKASGDKKDKKAKPKKKKKGEKEVEGVAQNIITVLRFPTEGGLVVNLESKVAVVRPHIVCCILRDLDFHQSNNMFRNFIAKQTRLHEDVCQKRQVATIATHDLGLVKGPLVYTSKNPGAIMITPLFKSKEVSGGDYYRGLQMEADALRKEKKRSTVSGIHKYLDLLKNKREFPCLLDSEGRTISLPPLTNSDVTKISKDTTNILVEVTSSVSLDLCKKVMATLLKVTLEMGVARGSQEGEETAAAAAAASEQDDEVVFSDKGKLLTVQQVRVEDEDGALRVVYPSRVDLTDDDSYLVERE